MLVLTLRRVVAWALGLVLVVGTATALGIAVFPLVTGGSSLAVLSGSMAPGLPVGAMALVRPVEPEAIAVGDVITFQRTPDAPALVTHRVVAVDTSGGAPVFTTKGDANEEADLEPVAASAVRGKLWFGVPHLGRLSAVLHSPKGVGFLVVLVCAVIAISPGPRPSRTEPRRGTTQKNGAPTTGTGALDPAELVDAADARTVVMAVVDAGGEQTPAGQPSTGPPPVRRPPLRLSGARPPVPPRPLPRRGLPPVPLLDGRRPSVG